MTKGIVGAGLMASQLAILFLRRLQVPVVISDLDRERVDKGLENVAAEILRLLEKRRIGPDEANRLRALISGTTDLADFADCDFVIEAVFEDMSIKKQVFADLEKHVFDSACSPRTPPRCPSRRWQQILIIPSEWSASISSTRWRCCRWWRSFADRRPTRRRWPQHSTSRGTSRRTPCWSTMQQASW